MTLALSLNEMEEIQEKFKALRLENDALRARNAELREALEHCKTTLGYVLQDHKPWVDEQGITQDPNGVNGNYALANKVLSKVDSV